MHRIVRPLPRCTKGGIARRETVRPATAVLPDSPVLYLDKADYRIHGFDGSARISLPEGCIRLIKDDVIYLYNHTPLETPVVVAN